MSKKTFEFTTTRVVFESSLHIDTVVARLDNELHRSAGGPALFDLLRRSQTREEIEQGIHEITQGNDFMFFTAIQHHPWMRTYTKSPPNSEPVHPSPIPKLILYTIGNPLIAYTMLRHSFSTALHVPLRILVLENDSGITGTRVVYDLPSSVIAPGMHGQVDTELRLAAEALDAKLEHLISNVTKV